MLKERWRIGYGHWEEKEQGKEVKCKTKAILKTRGRKKMRGIAIWRIKKE